MDFLHEEAWEGYGSQSMEEVQNLLKALQAQEGITDIANLVSVGALQPQSLEGTLAMLTFQDKHLTLWKDIPKGSAMSTLEEYTVQTGYGMDNSGWVQQMESPLEADPSAKRKYAMVKFQRQMWKVADVAGIVKTITDAETWTKQAATLRCLRNLNRHLYSSNSDMCDEFIDGFQKTIENNGSADHVIDARGGSIDQTHFRQAAELITANFGNVAGANLYVSPGGMTTIDSIMQGGSYQRILQNNLGADGGLALGYATQKIHTSFGSITPKVDIFIASEYEGKGVPKRPNPSNPEALIEGATSTKAPDAPAIAVTVVAPPVTGSKWASSGVRPAVATYRYRVAAGNRWGLSQACVAGDGGDVAAGGSIEIEITPAGTGEPATYYEIYSEAVEASGDYKLVGRIADSGGATTTYVDLNANIPGTTCMFLLDLTSVGEMRTFMLKRLAPVHSKEYARIGEYRWGTVNLYATPIYYAPLRFVLFKNVAIGTQSKSNFLEI